MCSLGACLDEGGSELKHPQKPVERRTHLMGHHRQEGVLGFVGLLQLVVLNSSFDHSVVSVVCLYIDECIRRVGKSNEFGGNRFWNYCRWCSNYC